MILPLSQEEKISLQKISPRLRLALKKLFINASFERPANLDVNFLAAQRIAINMIYDLFHDLDGIQPEETTKTTKENMI